MPEYCIDIITVLENICNGKRDAGLPEMLQMTNEGCGVVDGWTGVNILCFWTWNVSVGGAVGIGSSRTIGAINSDATSCFSDCPLNGIDHQAVDEIQQRMGQMNVKGFFFFLGKFCFRCIQVLDDGRVVIIGIPD
jgi:hypothetical protein